MKNIEHKEFAKRLTLACDGNANVPLPNFGRLGWFVTQLEAHNIASTAESVRKWFAGEALPRHKTMKALAQILKVDEAWLALGKASELDERQQKLRDATVDGAVNVVAGLIQMCGAAPAFPDTNDQRALDERIDIYAIIKGAQYAFHIAMAGRDGDGWRFTVPVEAEKTFIIGVVRTGELSVDLLELDTEALLQHGQRKGAFFDVHIDSRYCTDGKHWRQIRTFATRP
ncbi:hypothetical protein [Asticcacaulis sp. AND118]|uniref:hypothetical protein n=1 Tax=Asticcacaulis sp. AND118 TaxID=2840468 RepID=UPI001CFF7B8B|nr:hypothetical protein [Asticcacaulis sp. AND118]UDF03437.1 hypothetical protein LH365_13500 [Asticcacaulis sp. AND118]